MMKKKKKLPKWLKEAIIILSGLILVFAGVIIFWISTFKIPDLNSFSDRKVTQSTKIYDRTGEVLLYDVFENAKRISVPIEQISYYVKNATVAIEDADFYEHHGIKITSFIRAVLANIGSGSFGQGGSTITQQVVKNSILTTEKTITRKIKEWVLSLELERVLSKDKILEIYLNESPYGGTIYGVEQASQTFFGKSALNLTLAESAYIAALPQAPTHYSPYGNYRDDLEYRKNLVLAKMLELGFIKQEEYDIAKKEKVTFKPQEKTGILAPHFVTYTKQYLEEKYGQKFVQENGLKVITTLDYGLQQKAEEIVKKYALENKEKFNAENAALVAIDPKTGQILAMVGSRDYFDKEIDGNFNVALAHRQPGSTFKPFAYATAFNKGYAPETVVFDVPTEFQSTCDPMGKPISTETDPKECYMPENYDGKYLGPISLRDALAQSRNIPAVKVLYLAGIADTIRTAQNMGISSLGDSNQYGLTLVLGGGEVSLLEMTSAYGVFANGGIKNNEIGILKIEDLAGNIVESFSSQPIEALPENTALLISDILNDDKARQPAYGVNSNLYFPGRDVAVKTGTTNDYKDAWIVGYTPSLVVGAWAGNNSNTPMDKKVAGQIIAPLWNAYMREALKVVPEEYFKKPLETDRGLKPILRGFWQGNDTYTIDKVSGALATEFTPEELREEKSVTNIHSILYWIDRTNPLGPQPFNPDQNYQFSLWEYPIQEWLKTQNIVQNVLPTTYDTIHTLKNKPVLEILEPSNASSYKNGDTVNIKVKASSVYPVGKIDFYLDGEYIGSTNTSPFNLPTILKNNTNSNKISEIKVVVYDTVQNRTESIINLTVQP
ncbi:MAG: PBP1A family penicillin-binding protein [Minisyncoccia bacterium]